MLNQVQYHQAFVENKTGEEIGGFRGDRFLCENSSVLSGVLFAKLALETAIEC